MPKMKTNKSASKRFRVSASGKFMHGKANKQKLNGHKSSKRMRKLRHTTSISKSNEGQMSKLLPYS